MSDWMIKIETIERYARAFFKLWFQNAGIGMAETAGTMLPKTRYETAQESFGTAYECNFLTSNINSTRVSINTEMNKQTPVVFVFSVAPLMASQQKPADTYQYTIRMISISSRSHCCYL